MKRTLLLLPLLALVAAPAPAAAPASADAPPEVEPPARFRVEGFELRAFQDAAQTIPPAIFSDAEGRHPDPPEGGAFRASCNVFLVIEGDRRVLVDAGNGAPRGSLLAQLREEGIDPATVTDVLLTHEHPDHVGGLLGADGAPAFPNATLHAWWPPESEPDARAAFAARFAGYRLDLFADAASASNLPAGFVAEPAPGHTPHHCLYRKKPLLFVGDAFHAIDLQIARPEFCARWDRDRDAAVAVRRALLERCTLPVGPMLRELSGILRPGSTGPAERTESEVKSWTLEMAEKTDEALSLCGAHFPFPGVGAVVATAADATTTLDPSAEPEWIRTYSPVRDRRDAPVPTPRGTPRLDPGTGTCRLEFGDRPDISAYGGLFSRDAGPIRGLEWIVGAEAFPAVGQIDATSRSVIWPTLVLPVPDGPPPDRLRYASDGNLVNGDGVAVESFDLPVDRPREPSPPPERDVVAWVAIPSGARRPRTGDVFVSLPRADGLRIADVGDERVHGLTLSGERRTGEYSHEWQWRPSVCEDPVARIETNAPATLLRIPIALAFFGRFEPHRIEYAPRTVGALVRADGSPVGPFAVEVLDSAPSGAPLPARP